MSLCANHAITKGFLRPIPRLCHLSCYMYHFFCFWNTNFATRVPKLTQRKQTVGYSWFWPRRNLRSGIWDNGESTKIWCSSSVQAKKNSLVQELSPVWITKFANCVKTLFHKLTGDVTETTSIYYCFCLKWKTGPQMTPAARKQSKSCCFTFLRLDCWSLTVIVKQNPCQSQQIWEHMRKSSKLKAFV